MFKIGDYVKCIKQVIFADGSRDCAGDIRKIFKG